MKRIILPYNPKLKDRAKELRNNSTFTEILLWNELKQKKMLKMDFDRQKPILNYIVDFYCKDLMLAIEIDGGIHDYQIEYDVKRQKDLEKIGISFLRFEDDRVKKEMEFVLKEIENWIKVAIQNGFVGRRKH